MVTIATAPPGPGLDPDAMSYLGAAESLVRSGTYRVPASSWASTDTTEPLSHFPPGFPTAIAGPAALGLPPVQAARLLIVLAAFCTWGALVLLLSRAAGTRVAVLAALVMLATPAIINVHLSVLTEPLFLTALLATVTGTLAMRLGTVSEATGGTEHLWVAWWTGVAAAAAIMLRYASVALLVAACIVAFRSSASYPRPWRTRLRRGSLILLPTLCTLGPWLVRTIRLGGPRSVRQFGAYGDLSATVREGRATIAAWLAPVGDATRRHTLAGIIIAVATGVAVLGWVRAREAATAPPPATEDNAARERTADALLSVITVVAICYLAVLVASRAFADPNIPFDERILSPLFLLVELAVAVRLAAWWRGRNRISRAVVATMLVLWTTASVVTSVARVAYALEDGNDFAGSEWRESPTIAWVRAPTGGAHSVLYTNWPAALYFHAHRASHDIPAATTPHSADALIVRRFRDRLARAHGVVVGFAVPSPDVINPDTLAHALGLRALARFGDGTVWTLPSDPERPPPPPLTPTRGIRPSRK